MSPCRERVRRKAEQENQLGALDPGYWKEGFNAAGAELAALPTQFDEHMLEKALEDRSRCLEVINSSPRIDCTGGCMHAAALSPWKWAGRLIHDCGGKRMRVPRRVVSLSG